MNAPDPRAVTIFPSGGGKRPTCEECGEELVFDPRRSRASVRFCSDKCRYRNRDRKRYDQDPEGQRAKSRAYYARNREKKLAAVKAYHARRRKERDPDRG